MKIPTTPPSGTPFYHGAPINGMEMNPQWQGNGVVMEGGAPGNGAAYMVPHMLPGAGFAPPPGYYAPEASPPAPPAPPSQDFSEYMWMENEEEFDKQVMQQLEEEALMEQCIEAMLADEREAQTGTECNLEEQVSKSTLNPLAAEFIPTFSGATVAPSTSDHDPQQGLSTATSNVNKSIESSMSELSISQASDAPTDSSKSSTVEIAEELCNLPMDEKPDKPKDDENKCSSDTMPVVSANLDESPVTPETDETPDECSPCESKTVETSNKLQAETQMKKPQISSKGGVPKSSKPKDTESKSASPAEVTPTEGERVLSSPVFTESDKTVPVVSAAAASPAVFNYAAAARANLPSKPAASSPVMVAPSPPAPKQDSVPKETASTPTAPLSGGGAKQQSKPAAPKQQNKQNKDAKDMKTGTRGPNATKKTGAKK